LGHGHKCAHEEKGEKQLYDTGLLQWQRKSKSIKVNRWVAEKAFRSICKQDLPWYWRTYFLLNFSHFGE
jgi:hypothetical protein